MNRYCFALDLKDDPELIGQYEEHHKKVWPEIISSIRDSGIENLEIYRLNTRLIMIMDVSDDFSFDKKAAADAINPMVEAWEQMMWKYQQSLPGASKGEKWMLMNKIFDLKDY